MAAGQEKVDHYGATYGQFATQVYAEVRAEAFGTDLGQTGWLTLEEQDLFRSWLQLTEDRSLFDVACGSGGPALRIARLDRCRVCGVDLHEDAIRAAQRQAEEGGLTELATFQQADGGGVLPFVEGSFDAVICVDAINHLPDRPRALREWARVLKPGGRLVFTDPITVTGPLSNDEMAMRAAIGYFLFVPPGYDEQVLEETGFALLERVDRTENMARLARRWREARKARAAELRQIEGDSVFDGQQRFFEVAARLAESRRLSRFAFCAQVRA